MDGGPGDLLGYGDGNPRPRLVHTGRDGFGCHAHDVWGIVVSRHALIPHARRHRRPYWPTQDNLYSPDALRSLSFLVVLVILTDRLTPELVLVIAFLSGLVRPSEQGIRSSLMAALVPTRLLLTATSLSRTTLDSARVVGALVGSGLFAIVGITVTYIVILVLFFLGLVLLSRF